VSFGRLAEMQTSPVECYSVSMLLRNVYLNDTRRGFMVYPSSSARRQGGGGYIEMPSHKTLRDSELFPALVLDPIAGRLLTPTGVRSISPHSLVSIER
jgi:hypothetical protein